MKITFLSGLALLFIGLKLTGYIDWTYWWVLCPLWVPLSVYVIIVVVCLVIVAVANILLYFIEGKEGYARWKQRERTRKAAEKYVKALRKK